MKKLNKIRLYDFQEMNEVKMKNILGGSGVNNCLFGKAPCICN